MNEKDLYKNQYMYEKRRDPYGNYHYDYLDYRDPYDKYYYDRKLEYEEDFKAEQKRQKQMSQPKISQPSPTPEASKSPTGATHQVTGEKMAEQKPATIGNLDNINSDLNIRRKRLAEKVIKLFDKNGYVFGGYLRDEVAGVPFTDVDIFFPSRNVGYERAFDSTVVSELKKAGLTIIDLGEKKTYLEPKEFEDENGKKRKNRHRDHFMVRKFELEDKMTGTTVQFDMVFGSILERARAIGVNKDFPFVAGLDADVNCLWRGKNGQLCVAPNMANKTTVDEVKKNIINRVFVPMNDKVREERLNKLTAKGYKAIAKATTKVSTVSKKDKKESIMTTSKNEQSFSEQMKDEIIQGAYQAAGDELAAGVKEGLLAAAKSFGADDGAIGALTAFLDTPAGLAAIESALGHALPHAPMIGDNEHVEAVAKQMRVRGYAQGMKILFSVMMQFILPLLSATFEKLDKQIAAANSMTQMLGPSKGKTKARIAKDAEHEAEGEAEAEAEAEHETAAPSRSKKAA